MEGSMQGYVRQTFRGCGYMKKLVLIMIVAGLAGSALAEFRVWTDRKGNTLEAEFVGTQGKKIILKKQDGTTLTISPLPLTDDDKEYLYGKVPDGLLDPETEALDLEKPRLEIRFKKVTDTDNELEVKGFRDIHIVGRAKIIRKSTKPYPGQLTAFMYVIGHNDRINGYVLLDSTAHDLDLKKNHEISLSGNTFIIHEDKELYTFNTQYAGYVVVVKDEENSLIAIKSSHPKYQENYKKFENRYNGTTYTWDFHKHSAYVSDVRYKK